IGLRRRRSTQTPAGSAKRMNGRKPSTVRSENSNGVACSPTAASQEIASTEICEPTSLTDWPAQSLRKSPLLQSPPDGRRSLRIGRPPEERVGEPERLPGGVVGGDELVVEPLGASGEASRIVFGAPGAQNGEG